MVHRDPGGVGPISDPSLCHLFLDHRLSALLPSLERTSTVRKHLECRAQRSLLHPIGDRL